MKKYSGSGIIPIIRDKRNNFYIVLFKSTIRKKGSESLLEDAGGKYEGDNIKVSAIRELKEESSMLFNLENLQIKDDIMYLNKILSNFKIESENLDGKYYVSHFIYLDYENGFDLEELQNNYKINLRNCWKNGFSVYTENKDIIFIPIKNIKANEYIKDYNNKEYLLFKRTFDIIKQIDRNFIESIIKLPFMLKKVIRDTVTYQ
jgi:hypothetical protein